MAKRTKQERQEDRQDRKAARQRARSERKELRQDTRERKQDVRQEKRSTRKAARKDARETKQEAREEAKDLRRSARGGSKSEKKAARKGARAVKQAGRQEARSTRKTARKGSRVEAREERGTIRDDKREGKADIRADKREAIRATRKGWENWLHDLRTDARRVQPPRTPAELRRVVEAAVEAGKRLKPVASGHSHSNATQPSRDHWYVDCSELTGLVDTAREARTWRADWRRRDRKHVVRVLAGTRIQELTSQLLAPRDLGLRNMGSFDGQTVSGVVNTDTHGTGIDLGGFGDGVLSADLFVVVPDPRLRPRVELWRLEPEDGPTDPDRAGSLREHGVDRLVQDDDLFHAMVVGYGSFGVACSYLLEVGDFHWLDEQSRITSVDGLAELWADAGPDRMPEYLTANRHPWVFVNAAWAQVDNADPAAGDPRGHGQIPVRLLTQNPVRRRAIPADFDHQLHPLWPPMRRRDGIGESVGKNVLTKLAASGKRATRTPARLIDEGFIEDGQPPFFHTGDRSAYYRVLRRTRDNALEKARTPGCRWDNTRIGGAPKPPTLGLSMDVSVPAWELPRALRRVLRGFADADVKFGVPIGIRFTAPSEHWMAASYGRPSAYLELVGTVENPHHRERDLARYKRALTEVGTALRGSVRAARPHLGKHHGLDHDSLLRTFPRAEEWLTVQGVFDWRRTWSSPFTATLGASGYRRNGRQARAWLEERLGPLE